MSDMVEVGRGKGATGFDPVSVFLLGTFVVSLPYAAGGVTLNQQIIEKMPRKIYVS